MRFFFFFLLSSSLHAAVWNVGPTRTYTVPSAVAALVADGDTVLIDPGNYSGDVAKWFAGRLLLRCPGPGYAHLEAAGNYAEGKAIWVIKGADCVVEGIEFSGCKVPDHNGAGIRQEGKNLTLRHCYFHHNEMGILTNNDGVSDYLFESCEFAFNGFGDGYSHNIYVGAVNSLTLRFCYSHDAHVGHLVKSRARFNYILYNRLSGEAGDGSYEVDMPNGGRAILIGNIIEQAASSENGGIITLGLENQNHPEQYIALAHNTIINNRFSGRFINVSNATTRLNMRNNLFLGPGTLIQGSIGTIDSTHNLWYSAPADALLNDVAQYDCMPTAAALCVDAGTAAGLLDSISLEAQWMYQHPMQALPRSVSGAAADIGAYELQTSRVHAPASAQGLRAYPNPSAAGSPLQLSWDTPTLSDETLSIFSANGQLVHRVLLPKGSTNYLWAPAPDASGLYLLQMGKASMWLIRQP